MKHYPTGRLSSLDAFRGFTIAAMVLVNNPGDWKHLYSQLEHASWNGWTFTDWIFPFFLFIGGVSMTMSLGRRAEQGADKGALLLQLFKRALVIFLVGFLLNLIPAFNCGGVRIPGVLQRIAICTMLAAPIVVYFSWRAQCLWILGLLGFYSLVMLAVPVPDQFGVVHTGLLEAGADVGSYIDRLFLSGHMWVQTKTWDPEGLFTTLPAVCSQLFGVLAGRWLMTHYSRMEKTVWMLIAGLFFLWIGSMLDVALMPINKSLWTSSYCIFITGWALIMFALFYWFLDTAEPAWLRAKAAALCQPFLIYGMNALFIFAFSGLVAKMMGFIKITGSGGALVSLKGLAYAPIAALGLAPVNSSLLFAILFNLAMFVVAWLLWRKGWFVKI
jgi:predicted acyltransferase